MEVAVERGAMPPEVQIKCAVEEGMENIFLAIFGEHISCNTSYCVSTDVTDGVQIVRAQTVGTKSVCAGLSVEAEVPISHPDAEHGNYRIADTSFAVNVTGKEEYLKFEAWCKNNPSLGAKVVVRRTDFYAMRGHYQWTVADSMECEVIYQGAFVGLPDWAKEIAVKHWTDAWIHSDR